MFTNTFFTYNIFLDNSTPTEVLFNLKHPYNKEKQQEEQQEEQEEEEEEENLPRKKIQDQQKPPTPGKPLFQKRFFYIHVFSLTIY